MAQGHVGVVEREEADHDPIKLQSGDLPGTGKEWDPRRLGEEIGAQDEWGREWEPGDE